jgi:hypothetical protein
MAVLKPLPTKTRTSFDIPKLLAILKKDGEYRTSAKFEDLMVVRNYLFRHDSEHRLSQAKIEGGYVIKLERKHDQA